jgi:hypothetical protein
MNESELHLYALGYHQGRTMDTPQLDESVLDQREKHYFRKGFQRGFDDFITLEQINTRREFV